jgi:hypothetical protein
VCSETKTGSEFHNASSGVMERERNGRVGRSERREEREKWEELWALSGSYFLINRRISTLLVCGN